MLRCGLLFQTRNSRSPSGREFPRQQRSTNTWATSRILEDEFESTDGGDLDVFDAIVANPVSPERLLRRIFAGEFDASDSYEGHDLLMDLIKHPGIPRDVLEKIVARDFTWEMDEDALSEIATAVRQRLEQP